MDYEKIIVELLSRIQTLEEQVAVLIGQQEKKKESRENKVTTDDVREYIKELKAKAKEEGKKVLVLKCGDIHNALGLKHWHRPVCNAMRDCKNDNDIILYEPPKGNSSAFEIEYKL